jgi:hypothetical protein
VKAVAVTAQPGLGLGAAWEDAVEGLPEAGGMVEGDEVSGLVGADVVGSMERETRTRRQESMMCPSTLREPWHLVRSSKRIARTGRPRALVWMRSVWRRRARAVS